MLQHIATFAIFTFIVALTQVGMPFDLAVIINMFVLAPFSIGFNRSFQKLLELQLLKSEFYREKLSGWVTAIDSWAFLTSLFCLLVALFVLFLATMFTNGASSGIYIVEYFFEVQLFQFLVEIVLAAAHNISSFHFNMAIFIYNPISCSSVYVCSISVGGRFVEMVLRNNLVPGRDYVDFSRGKNCLYKIDFIVDKTYAEKKGWLAKWNEHSADPCFSSPPRPSGGAAGSFSNQSPVILPPELAPVPKNSSRLSMFGWMSSRTNRAEGGGSRLSMPSWLSNRTARTDPNDTKSSEAAGVNTPGATTTSV
jgi:hypothetical protein